MAGDRPDSISSVPVKIDVPDYKQATLRDTDKPVVPLKLVTGWQGASVGGGPDEISLERYSLIHCRDGI